MASGGSKVFTFDEVAKHNKIKDLWITIFGKVFDVSEFMDEHPGGVEVLLSVIGKNATDDFEDIGHSDYAKELMNKYCIGEVDQSTVPIKRTYIPPKEAPVSPNQTWDLVVRVLQFLLPLFVIAVGFSIRSSTYAKE